MNVGKPWYAVAKKAPPASIVIRRCQRTPSHSFVTARYLWRSFMQGNLHPKRKSGARSSRLQVCKLACTPNTSPAYTAVAFPTPETPPGYARQLMGSAKTYFHSLNLLFFCALETKPKPLTFTPRPFLSHSPLKAMHPLTAARWDMKSKSESDLDRSVQETRLGIAYTARGDWIASGMIRWILGYRFSFQLWVRWLAHRLLPTYACIFL